MNFTFVGFLIAIAPLLVLVALLLARRYPGEEVIQRLRSLIDLVFHDDCLATAAYPGFLSFDGPARGGQLIGCSLAGRAPPAFA